MYKLTITRISAQDLLDAARTIPLGDISTCDWLSYWVSTATFLEWARRGLQEGDSYGFSNALCYAKRAVCCRIDMLLRYNHLIPFFSKEYPQKIDALKQIGIGIPDVVHKLAIAPRNKMEHDYQNPDEAEARRAVGIADLCVRATDDERERASIVAVSWNAMSARAVVNDKVHYSFHEFNHRPMLFIDVFEDLQPPAAKIVDPDNKEVRLVTLNSFACKQAIELAQLLRGNYLRLPHFKWV